MIEIPALKILREVWIKAVVNVFAVNAVHQGSGDPFWY